MLDKSRRCCPQSSPQILREHPVYVVKSGRKTLSDSAYAQPAASKVAKAARPLERGDVVSAAHAGTELAELLPLEAPPGAAASCRTESCAHV